MTTTIHWELTGWTEKAENLAELSGVDDFGNKYSAGAYMAGEDIEELYDVRVEKSLASFNTKRVLKDVDANPKPDINLYHEDIPPVEAKPKRWY